MNIDISITVTIICSFLGVCLIAFIIFKLITARKWTIGGNINETKVLSDIKTGSGSITTGNINIDSPKK